MRTETIKMAGASTAPQAFWRFPRLPEVNRAPPEQSTPASRRSSVVEQDFCKVQAVSSILTAG